VAAGGEGVAASLLRAGPERLVRHSTPSGLSLWLRRTDVRPEPARSSTVKPPPVVPRTAEFTGRRVPVPGRVVEPDPLLAELEAVMDWPERCLRVRWHSVFPVSPHRPAQRMRRIWQAIIAEARFRGYTVGFTHNRRDDYDVGRLVVAIGPDEFPLELTGLPGALRLGRVRWSVYMILSREYTRERGS
jgi:hypothetical protein